MHISTSQKRTLIAANKQISKIAEKSESLVPYFEGRVIEFSFRTYRNIFHKLIIKIALCFCGDEKNLFKAEQKKNFLEELDTSINKIKNNYANQGSLIRAYTSNAEKSDVLIIFRDFFKGYQSCEVDVQGDYLHIYFMKDGGYKPEFYLSVYIELDTRNRFTPPIERKSKKKDILSSQHVSPLFHKNERPEIEVSKADVQVSPRSDDEATESTKPKKVHISNTGTLIRSASDKSIGESPGSKHSASSYETIPIESYNRIDFDFLYAVKTNEKSFFANEMILERLEISDKNLLKLRNDIHRNAFLKKDNELKVIYLVYLLNLLTVKPEDLAKRRNEFIDGIWYLKQMQPNIINIPIELNFSYWIMVEYDLMPHTVMTIRKYFLLLCQDRFIKEYLESLEENEKLNF